LIKVVLYSWGYNNFGQLGLGHETNKPIPQKVDELSTLRLTDISCKNSVSAAITEDGNAYTWGQSKVINSSLFYINEYRGVFWVMKTKQIQT